MKKNYTLTFLFIFLVSSLIAQYSLPIYEPFDGTTGTLAGQKGWTGTLGVGNGAQVVDYSLTYTGLYAAPVSKAILYGNQTSGGTQALGFTSQTTKVYASFLIQVSTLPLTVANSKYNFGFGSTTIGGTFAGCMYVVPTSSSTFELGFNGTNSTPIAANTTAQNFALNTTIMVVMAYTPGASGTGTVSAWVNPASASFGISPEPIPTFSNITGGSAATVSSVFIRSGNNTNPMNFDELRVATSWSDVTSFNTPLPVSITDFSLSPNGDKTTLSWQSKLEVNFDKYIIQCSQDGINFNEIGTIKAKGNNAKYEFNYSHSIALYFRLKMVDLDGKYMYSKTLVSSSKKLLIKIWPTLFVENLFISELPNGKNEVFLYSLTGVKLKMEIVQSSSTIINLCAIPSGSYFIQIINDGKLLINKIIIKN